MCYDISFTVQMKQLVDYFPDLIFDEQIKINFEPVHIMGHSYGEQPVIYTNREDGKIHLKLMEWGCIPFYIKNEKAFLKQRATMLNARAERVVKDQKSYWNKIRNRRCLVPVSAFYEHREVPKFKKKVPYLIKLKQEDIFFLPGLYSVAELPDEQTGEMQKRFTFTIITREANSLMKQIHNGGPNQGRMPLILTRQMAMRWVQTELNDEAISALLDYEIPSEALDYHTVYTIRSQERPDGKEKNQPFEWESLPELNL